MSPQDRASPTRTARDRFDLEHGQHHGYFHQQAHRRGQHRDPINRRAGRRDLAKRGIVAAPFPFLVSAPCRVTVGLLPAR